MRVQFGARMAWLVLLLAAGLAHAEDPIVERAWFEDRTGEMTLEEVKRQAFTPFEGNLSRGFGSAPLWVRLTIDPSRLEADRLAKDTLILRVLAPLLLEVEVHDPSQPDRTLVTGLLSDPEAEVAVSRYPSFALPRGESSREVWLKLRTHHTRYIPIEVLSVGQWVERKAFEWTLTAVYLLSLAVLLFWALWSYYLHRDRILFLFSLYLLVFIGYASVVFGEHRMLQWPWLGPALVDRLVDSVVLFSAGIMALFFYELLREYRPPVLIMRLILGSVATWLLLWFLAITGHEAIAFPCHNLLVAVAAMLPPLCALTSRPPAGAAAPVIPVGWLTALLSINALVLILNALNVLGLTSEIFTRQFFTVFNGPAIGLLLLVYLQVRQNRMSMLQQRTLIDLQAARRNWEREKSSRQEREELLAMLAHEIKTPLSTLKFGLAGQTQTAPVMIRAVSDMEGVIDRCIQLGLLEGSHIEPAWAHCELGEILAEVAEGLGCTDRIDWSEALSGTLHTDRRLLEIIVRNLLDNARKYGAADVPIGVSSRMLIKDNIQGMEIRIANQPGEAGWPEAERIFSKYYRAAGARRGSGSGLGLYLVAGLTRMLGGTIEYLPSATHVQFVLWLPLGRPEQAE
ncbi:MAG: ATP-binding protein [Steroidobacteraceae bacterium]